MKTKLSTASKLYILFIMLFMYAPILVMIFFSFNSMNSTSVFGDFSLRWYQALIQDENAMKSLYNTLILAACSSIISTIIGTAAAVGIEALNSKLVKRATMTVTNIPMMNPEIVTGISMMLLFVVVGKLLGISNVLGFGTMLIAHITFNLPYVILSVLPKLRQMDPHLPEAAMDLGCTPLQAFFKVTLPSISTGIVSGMMMAFTLSIDDFVISYFTQGPSFETLAIHIFSMTKKRVTPEMYALSTLIFVAILLLLVMYNFAQSRGEKKNKKKEIVV